MIFETFSGKFNFHCSLTRITGTLHKDPFTFMISFAVLVKMRNVSDKICGQNQNPRVVLLGPVAQST